MLKHLLLKQHFVDLLDYTTLISGINIKKQLLLKKEVNSLNIFQMLTKAFFHHVFSSKNINLDFFCDIIK